MNFKNKCFATPLPDYVLKYIKENHTPKVVGYTGSMRSRKTGLLIDTMMAFAFHNFKCLILRSTKDTRRSVLFDDTLKNTMKVENLKNIDISNYGVLFVDEGQFFDDICQFANLCIREKKYFFYTSLKLDFRAIPWGLPIISLIMGSDRIETCVGTCIKCGKEGTMSSRVGDKKKQILIDSAKDDEYENLCRSCYIETNKERKHCFKDIFDMSKNEFPVK